MKLKAKKVKTGGPVNDNRLYRRINRRTLVLIIALSTIVVLTLLVATLYLNEKEEYSYNVCSNDGTLLRESINYISQNDRDGLDNQAELIVEKPGHELDASCMAILVAHSVHISDYSGAKERLDRLEYIYEEDKLPIILKNNNLSKADLKIQVESLGQQIKEAEENVLYF